MSNEVRIVQAGPDPGNPPAGRRHPRHRRVVRKGTEWFDADGVKLDPEDMDSRDAKNREDDSRILTELPPHWGVYSERQQAGA